MVRVAKFMMYANRMTAPTAIPLALAVLIWGLIGAEWVWIRWVALPLAFVVLFAGATVVAVDLGRWEAGRRP